MAGTKNLKRRVTSRAFFVSANPVRLPRDDNITSLARPPALHSSLDRMVNLSHSTTAVVCAAQAAAPPAQALMRSLERDIRYGGIPNPPTHPSHA